MKFESIAELFSENTIELNIANKKTDVLYPILFSSPAMFDFQDSVVIGTDEDIIANNYSSFPNIIILSSNKKSHIEINKEKNYIIIYPNDISQTRETVLSVISYAIHTCSNISENTFYTKNDFSLSTILSTASRAISHPLIFLDSNGGMVECAQVPFSKDWISYISKIIDYFDKETLAKCFGLISNTLSKNQSISLGNTYGKYFLSIPIIESRVSTYVLVAVSDSGPFMQIERAIITEFALCLSGMLPRLPKLSASGDKFTYLLKSLLLSQTNSILEEDKITLQKRGWKEEHRYYTMCILFPNKNINLANLNNYIFKLQDNYPKAFYLANRDRIYMVNNVSLNQEKKYKDEVVELIHSIKDFNNSIIGVSNTYRGIKNLHTERIQSELTIDIGKIIFNNKTSYEYDKYFIYHLLLSCSDSLDLDSMIHPFIRELQIYDKDNNTEYCDTLNTYLNCNMKANESAKQLNIHKNTMDYRLRRMQELFHPRFEESDRILSFKLSFEIMNYLNNKEKIQELIGKY